MSRVDAIARLLDATRLARALPQSGPLLMMYHGVGGSDGVRVDDFAAQLDLLRARRRVVSLREAVSKLGTPDARGLAAVTFDDGYRDFAELAVPVLREREIHATVFVPAGRVGGRNDWDAGYAEPRDVMGEAMLRSLDARWVEIGAHGATHCRLRDLEPADLREETAGARARLEALCDRPVRLFAYPYGQGDDFDEAAERAVIDAGFEAACSTRFGRGSTPADRYRLRRVGVECHDTLATLERKLDGAYDWTAYKEALGVRLRAWRAGRSRR